MADYWKSQPKKFCQYCKCWIADNKPSVEFHERGKNHKENVAAKIAEIKKKSVAKAKQEQKMSKEFAAMEEAALKAYEEDLKRLTAQSSGVSLPPPEPPAKTQKKPKKRPANVPSGNVPSGTSSRSRPDVWVGGTTGDGQLYYFNTATGESQWEKPDGFLDESSSSSVVGHMQDPSAAAWMEAVSPDGYMYFYNTETGQSSWEKPDGFSSEDICPPGVESPRDVMITAENSSPVHPEPPSAEEDSSDPPKDTPEPEPEPEQTKDTSGVKISFRKRKDEPIQTSSDDGGEKTPDDGGEKTPDDGGNAEEKEEETSAPVAVKEIVIPVKRARKINPYGSWERITPVEDPYEKVDLQLPQVESFAPAPSVAPPEPRPAFKERTITSLGPEDSAGTTFRKRRTENGKSRILRQRGKDE